MISRARLPLLAAVLLSVACRNYEVSPPRDSASGSAPPSTATTATVGDSNPVSAPPEAEVVLPDGYRVNVEVGVDPTTRNQGLMFRESLPKGKGMLFVYPQSGEYPFWMKNTLIPLDIVWIDELIRIVHIEHSVPPCVADPCRQYPPRAQAKYILEFPAGEAKAHGLAVNAQLSFVGLEKFRQFIR